MWMDIVDKSPELSHFHCDELFVPTMMYGGVGVDTVLGLVKPSFMIDVYDACVKLDWQRALKMQAEINGFLRAVSRNFPERSDYADCSWDKAVVEAGGFLLSSDPRPPFLPVPDQIKERIRESIDREFSHL